uniref:Flavodoxin-like fold domain-containing protein n=1 Tax=Acanthochromis polyacanthus TaxID=80966 RepID=A0A3Q1EG10_9TELE
MCLTAQKTALIVFAHQTPASFNATARDVAVQELSDQGYRVLVSDLYAMKFRAEATRDDIKGELKNPELFQYGDETMFAWMENQLSEDITAEQQKVTEAELIIFQFPLYWFSVPAILKGWFDRVLAQGFAFSLEKMYDNGVFKVFSLPSVILKLTMNEQIRSDKSLCVSELIRLISEGSSSVYKSLQQEVGSEEPGPGEPGPGDG